MSDPTYPLFPIFAFVGFVASLVPFPWHLQAWNAGTCAYMIWASFACLIEFVDSLIWHGNLQDVAPVWCDISTKFLIGAGVGIPASALCINRRLYSIASVRNISIGREERRRATIIDLCISVGIPMLVMILHYIVQGHRFNILEDIGCTPAIYNTLPAYPLVFMWPVLLSLISFVYAGLTLRAFWVRRIQFSELVSSASSMTVNRYFRLMLLSCLTMLLNTPLSAFSIYINTHGLQLSPWVSWSDAHYNFSFVEQIPAVIWRSSVTYTVSAEMSRWIYPFSALIFFGLFGFADEARRNYVAALAYVVSKLGLKPLSRAKKLGFTTALSSGYGFKSSSSPDTPLPPYMPRAVVHVDLEKAVFYPPSPTSSFSCSATETHDETTPSAEPHRIIVSDEYPASSPPSPLSVFYLAPPTPLPQAVISHSSPVPHPQSFSL